MLENLKRLRIETGVSQKSLAEAIGVSQQSINKYENHKIEPDIETLIRIADYFKTSVDYLVGHTHFREPMTLTSANQWSEKQLSLISAYQMLNKREQESIDLILENYTNKRI